MKFNFTVMVSTRAHVILYISALQRKGEIAFPRQDETGHQRPGWKLVGGQCRQHLE